MGEQAADIVLQMPSLGTFASSYVVLELRDLVSKLTGLLLLPPPPPSPLSTHLHLSSHLLLTSRLSTPIPHTHLSTSPILYSCPLRPSALDPRLPTSPPTCTQPPLQTTQDLVFNFYKVYAILDEVFLAGEIEETSKSVILDRLEFLEKLE